MDNFIGVILSVITSLKTAVKTLVQLSGDYNALLARISLSPGIPTFPTTSSHWPETVPVTARLLHTSEATLPEHVDIVIIGSGLTGTLVARSLLEHPHCWDLKFAMLEARDVCSGATGRNGGHIKCDPHLIYHKYKVTHGRDFAEKATRFSMAHVDELIRISEKVGGENETEARRVETVDAYFDTELFARACRKVETFEREMPVESKGIRILSAQESQENYGLNSLCVGAITSYAGAINPYKLVTRLLTSFEEKYPERFTLVSRCPITNIEGPSKETPRYRICTAKGSVTASHIIHATNAHVGYLVPGLRSKIFPLRQTMSSQHHRSFAQTPSSTVQVGGRSFSFFYAEGFDYLTERPDGTIMLGGGFAQSPQQGMAEVGINTDNSYDATAAAHICGTLNALFKDPSQISDPSSPNAISKIGSVWSGSVGVSADGLPWVGRLSSRLTGRMEPDVVGDGKIAPPGEWVSAGYSGEGMVNAPLCAKALAMMILKPNDKSALSWFPEHMYVTDRRWKQADASALLDDIWD